jgi:DNA-binding PadR family transcriptional regulator
MKEARSKFAVLGMLTLRPMSGYDVKKAFEQSIQFFWNESFGQIYPMLHALVKDGLATCTTKTTPKGRERHVYAITAAGRRALKGWLAEELPRETPRVEILLKLFFARHAGEPVVRAHLTSFRSHLARMLDVYAATEAALASARERPDYPYWLMTLRYGQHVNRALVAWADESIETLNEVRAPNHPAHRRRG